MCGTLLPFDIADVMRSRHRRHAHHSGPNGSRTAPARNVRSLHFDRQHDAVALTQLIRAVEVGMIGPGTAFALRGLRA